MTSDVLVRQATEQDIPCIVELGMELLDYHRELDPFFSRKADAEKSYAEFVKGNIASEDACVVVAQVGAEIVGYCQARVSKYPPVMEVERFAEILDCFVREHLRSQGIGRRLAGCVRDWCRSKELERIEVRHSTKNPGAGNFWKKMGFEPYLKTLFMEI